MVEQQTSSDPALLYSTKVEEDFVSPLTAIRGSLEILRDYPNLDLAERQRFVETALRSCVRLEKGVEDLAKAVYSAGKKVQAPSSEEDQPEERPTGHESRVHFLDDLDVVEVDLSNLEFSSSQVVNEFYDMVERLVGSTRRHWYFLVNYTDCSIWPEAWVAFGHRGKRVNVGFSLGTVRYSLDGDAESHEDCDADLTVDVLMASRERALARIEKLKAAKGA